jgi:hypothetical protein
MKKLLAIATIVVSFAASASAGDFDDQDVMSALKKRFPDLQDNLGLDFIDKDEVTFYTPKWHMSCRYDLVPRIRFSKCHIIHG